LFISDRGEAVVGCALNQADLPVCVVTGDPCGMACWFTPPGGIAGDVDLPAGVGDDAVGNKQALAGEQLPAAVLAGWGSQLGCDRCGGGRVHPAGGEHLERLERRQGCVRPAAGFPPGKHGAAREVVPVDVDP
jgi:hypothetical protein